VTVAQDKFGAHALSGAAVQLAFATIAVACTIVVLARRETFTLGGAT
jgi:hypothetical protein